MDISLNDQKHKEEHSRTRGIALPAVAAITICTFAICYYYRFYRISPNNCTDISNNKGREKLKKMRRVAFRERSQRKTQLYGDWLLLSPSGRLLAFIHNNRFSTFPRNPHPFLWGKTLETPWGILLT